MLLKWTTRVFAMTAALPFGIAAAQNPDPLPASAPSATTSNSVQDDEDRNSTTADQNAAQDAVRQEARFAPSNIPAGEQSQVNDHVRSATQHLNIDDETRSRYRFVNGEWWFKTKSGAWKVYRDGRWQDFEPAKHMQPGAGGMTYAPAAGVAPATTYGASNGYSYQAQPGYSAQGRPYAVQSYSQPYRVNRPVYGAYNNGFNNGGYYGNGYNNGFYGPGYGAYGNGIQGYNPTNDTYNGYNAFGQSYSVPGGQYRGAVLGSQIGGQLGGQTGAVLGGAIGARAGR